MKNHAEPSRHTLASPVLRPHRPLCSLHAFWFTCKTSASRSRCSFGVHKENPINLRKRTSIEVVTSEFHTRNACFFTHPLKWHQSKVSGKNKNTEELKPVLHNGFTRAKSGVERLTLVISNDEKKTTPRDALRNAEEERAVPFRAFSKAQEDGARKVIEPRETGFKRRERHWACA